MPKKKDINWLHKLASQRGGRCLSTEYINNHTKYEWECGKCNYRWWASAGNVRSGYWCPKCAGNIRKNIGWLHELASQRGGRCLSTKYVNSNTKYEWECGECGCRWFARANPIQQGAWCPNCAGNIKKDINYLHKLATERGGECLSDVYVSIHFKYKWRCSKGHEWQAAAHSVQRGSWCSKCAAQERGHKRCKSIEYLYCLATLRGGKCLSTEYITNRTKYEWECGKCGYRWLASAGSVQQGCWCLRCSGKERHNVNWLNELAFWKNGNCLSTEYINCDTKYEWKCSRGHEFPMSACCVQRGQWCPKCAVQRRANLRCNNIHWLYELASQRGGRCLSTEYVNSKTKYEWMCKNGHRFFMLANGVQQGQWCPHCTHKHSKAELQIYEFVKQLYPDTVNGQRKLLFNPKFELDIYIPCLQKAIEFDGKFWHFTDEVQSRDFRKNQECEAKGIKLLRIPEQLFLDNPQQVFDIVKDFLQN